MHGVAIPHFDRPFSIVPVHGQAAIVEQDSDEDIENCLAVLFLTETGSRIEELQYGVTDVLFAGVLNTNELVARATEWEPRAALSITESSDSLDRLIRNVIVKINETRPS